MLIKKTSQPAIENKTKAGEAGGTRRAASLLLLAFIFLFLCSFPSSARAEAPILEIDTGGHRAKIRNIIFTSDGKYLVSASVDKTVLVWDAETGEVVRAIRGQIAEGDEGKIHAAALSPDNRILAAGGFMAHGFGINDDKVGNIRLIDFQTGQVVRLLKGHENVINGLAFSQDGRQLISGSGDKTARIWDVHSGETLHVLKGHTDRIYAVAFSPDGKRAATGSDDHSLKLWDSSTGALLATMEGHTDNVVSAAFTPDGKTLLSGSWDKTIRLWNGESGEFIKTLAEQDSTVDSLSISPDGTKVVTGIGAGSGVTNNVFSIPSGEKLASFTKHGNIVLATAISPDGKTAATGGGSVKEIYIWDLNTGEVKKRMAGKGRIIWSVGFSKDGKSIAWGKKGLTVSNFNRGILEQSFRLKDPDQGFNLAIGEKIQDAAAPSIPNPQSPIPNPQESAYLRAQESAGPFSIRTKSGGIDPALQVLKNGKLTHEITLDSTNGHAHQSLTLAPDGSAVISGAGNGRLASWNPETGKKIHDFVGHTGDVWGVAVSPDGRHLVSGSVDQTVKLWELASGKLLLTIFQGSDEEWVAWTPDGFYAASRDGGKYVGYHINRGEDKAADYVGLDQIGEAFYRPDLVAKSLQGGFEKEIQAELERLGGIDKIIASGLPPKVTIESDKELSLNQRDFTIDFSVEDQGGGIGKVEYRINGMLVASTEREEILRSAALPGQRRSGVLSKNLTGDHGENRVTITAYSQKGNIASKPVEIIRAINDPLEEKPSLYVLAVGVTNYYNENLNLKFAHSDAQSISDTLKLRGKGLFKSIDITTLTNEKADTKSIEDAFERLSKTVKTSDVFVLYLAGHGMAIDGNYHFIPHEAVFENMDSMKKESLSNEEIEVLLKKIPALKSLLIFDTCYAGLAVASSAPGMQMLASLSPPITRDLDEYAAIDRMMKVTGRAWLAATTERQKAIEGYEGHGVYTYVLLQGLKGKAGHIKDGNGIIDVEGLRKFVKEEVSRITKEKWGVRQIPMSDLRDDPFPIACMEGFEGPGCKKQGKKN